MPFLLAALVIILIPAVSVTEVFAKAREKEDLTVAFSGYSMQEDNLHASLKLKGKISDDNIDAIQNGITAQLYITLQLARSSPLLGIGKSISEETTETFNISYDVWENSYVIEDRKRKNVHKVKFPSQIVQTVNDIINPLVFDIGDWNTYNLSLRAKIKIKTIKLFPPFGIFLLFFDPWNYESEWIETEIVF